MTEDEEVDLNDIASTVFELAQSSENPVYYCARHGLAHILCRLLSEKSYGDAMEILNQQVLEDDGLRCTPFIVAAIYGHENVVDMLLSKFKVDIEQEGTVVDGDRIEGASALWCAAFAGHLDVVKTLVKAGANVNHPTKTNSTPLRVACCDGHLDIVMHLTEHGADIHFANEYNVTCLMVAASKGHTDVVHFLLGKGANPDEKSYFGTTALHDAARSGREVTVKELLNYGATMTRDENGMSPLITAAEADHAHVVEYLVTRPEVSRREEIEALELLGASSTIRYHLTYSPDDVYHCLNRSYQYLKRAMEMRYSDPGNLILKNPAKPVAAYENWIECQTLEELEGIQHNQRALYMEFLSIRERILGSQNPTVSHHVMNVGGIFRQRAQFDRCIELWLHALHLDQQNKEIAGMRLHMLTQVFSEMIQKQVSLTFSYVEVVLRAFVMELEGNKEDMASADSEDIAVQIMSEMECNFENLLDILCIITKLMKFCTREEEFRTRQLVFQLNQLQLKTQDGQTLLHLSINGEAPFHTSHSNEYDVCKFPCAAISKLLIQCGADVNAMDQNRNTPLHVFVSCQKSIRDLLTFDSIIMELIEAGAHLDAVNIKGETPFQAATTAVAKEALQSQTKLSLKCMAAKAVQIFNLPYQGQVPLTLGSFIELHGLGVRQG